MYRLEIIKSTTKRIAKEKEFCLNVGLSPHQEAFEFTIALEHAECPLYLNGSIHPEKRSFLGKKILKSGLSVFGRFYTHPDLFVFHLVGGLEALASEFAAGTIFTAVIVRSGNKAVFLFGTGTRKEDLSPSCAKKTILMFQRLHILDPPELRLEFLCLLLFVRERLNKAVLTMLFQIKIFSLIGRVSC